MLFIMLMIFWVALTWPAHPPGFAYLQDLGVGVAAALLVAVLMGDTDAKGLGRWLEPRRYGWMAVFLFVLAGYVIRANLDVVYRVFHPAMPISPGIIKIKTRLQQNAARTMLGNAVTLTPGTLSVDVRDDGVMFVHWICVQTEDEEEAARKVIGRFESYIEKIFN